MNEPNNQAMMMTLSEDVSSEALRRAVAALLQHHDALRSRYRTAESGWQQWVDEPGGEASLEVVELATASAGDRAGLIERHAAGVQASFDLAAGPLFKVVQYRCGDGESV